ncbi:MAG: PAS domain-containing protein [Alphaproteobacteria bacterium]|nr:PAS domain-containing protein [Alphaproteobacteria bacterium]
MKNSGNNTTILRHVLWHILPAVIPVLLVAFILTYKFTYNTIEKQEYNNIENELFFASQTLNRRLDVTKNWLSNLSQNGMIVNSLVDPQGAGEYIPHLLETLRVPGPQVGGRIELLDFQGHVLATNNIESTFDVKGEWFRKILSGTRFEVIDHSGLIMAEPIIINGLPEGALVLSFDPQTLSEFLNVTSARSHISLIDAHRHFLALSSGQKYFHVGDIYSEYNLKDWVTSTKTIDGRAGLTLVSAQKNSIAFKAVRDVQYALIAFIVIALGGIVLSLSLAGQSVTKVLANIASQLQTLRTKKDLSKRIVLSPIKELARLELSYNQMAADLQNTTVSKEYIDTLFEGLPLPVFVLDTHGCIVRTNDPALSLFIDEGDEIPTYLQDIIFHEDLEQHREDLIKNFSHTSYNNCDTFFYLSKKHGSHEIEMRLTKPQTEAKPYILSTTSFKDHTGKLTGYIVTATDIHDRKQKEEEILKLAEQNTLMARAIEEISLGVTISDGQKKHQPLIFCNQAFVDISGLSMKEIMGSSCSFLQGPETDPNTVKAISDAIRNRESIKVEILNYKKDGETFWNELSLNPIFDSDDSLKYYVGIQSDISDRKRVEAMKTEFISTVSHELRTPLTSIHGSLGLINHLYGASKNAEEKKLISIAYRNSTRLKFLIDDILDTEKLESGEMRFYPKSYELAYIIQQGVELNEAYGEKYKVNFVVLDSVPDTYINVDKNRIIQVFANLLSNAAKFSMGSNHVDIKAQKIDGADNMVRISVIDYGNGISDEFQKRIFTKFAQQDSSDVRKLSGTGLGLYITKKIVEAHDGKIGFETTASEGTTFYIDIPCSSSCASK